MPEINLRQADVPSGCRYMLPERGTAPGIAWQRDGKRVYAIPGVPAEMREMMQGTILPELSEASGASALVSRVIRATGIAESKVAELLDDLFRGSTNPTVAYLASSGEVKVRLTAKAASRGTDQATRGGVQRPSESSAPNDLCNMPDLDLNSLLNSRPAR